LAFIPTKPSGEDLKRYLERRSRGVDPEQVLAGQGPLAMRRKTVAPLMVCALISVECWVWLVIVPWFERAGIWKGTSFAARAHLAVGLVISIAAVAVIIAAAVMLFTEVDSRGIHRPD
jgi:hypothetical protein